MTSRRSLYLALLLLLGASAWAQRFKPAVPTDADAAELVSAGKDPVIRYPVAHFHLGRVGCAGYLYFSRNTVRYEVLSPESDATHGFDRPRSEIISVGEWHQMGAATNALELKFPTGPPYHFLRVRKQWVQTGRSGGLEALPYEEVAEAARSFDDVVARVEAREARLHPPPVVPPMISMIDPSGAEAGKVLQFAADRVTVRGVASHTSGISRVTVNNTAAVLKQLAPTTVEFIARDLSVNPGASPIVVVANAADKSTGELIFTVDHHEVRITAPSENSETDQPAIDVHGVAAGFHVVDRVEIAGKAASLHPIPGGDVEFFAGAVPLALGTNSILGFVATRDGARTPFKLDVKRNAPAGPAPLALAEVVEALQKGVPLPRVASLVTEFGVSFALSDEAEKQLRDAGANTDLLLAIAKAKK